MNQFAVGDQVTMTEQGKENLSHTHTVKFGAVYEVISVSEIGNLRFKDIGSNWTPNNWHLENDRECKFLPGDEIICADKESIVLEYNKIYTVHHCTHSPQANNWFVHFTDDESERHWQHRFVLHARPEKFKVKINLL